MEGELVLLASKLISAEIVEVKDFIKAFGVARRKDGPKWSGLLMPEWW